MTARLVGVEEELLLIDPATGESVALADRALAHSGQVHRPSDATGPPDRPEVEQEFYLQQIETANVPVKGLDDLREAIRAGRRAVGEAARSAGGAAVAVAVPVLDAPDGDVSGKRRYRDMVDGFGDVARGVVVCGMHTHVDVEDEEEAVAVIDRIRPWLPALLALSANSPFMAGRDTGYQSWRSQMWRRWPTAAHTEPFGDAAGYHAAVEELIESGAALDRGMVYLDARPVEAYSTVEVRVADVCTEIDDAVLVAALARALVETASREAQAGEPVASWRSELLTATTWRAARDGLSGQLVDPVSKRLAPAFGVIQALLRHTRDALSDSGDRDEVTALVDGVLSRGTGAARQRDVHRSTGSPVAVVLDALRRTEESWT